MLGEEKEVAGPGAEQKAGWVGVEGGTQTAGEQSWREEGAGNELGTEAQLHVPVHRERGAK